MQKYQSHKIVEAAKIIGWTPMTGGVTRLVLEGGEHAHANVDDRWVAARLASIGGEVHAAVGGYFVQYPDGYTSWSPAEAFEQGYLPFDNSPQGFEKTHDPKDGALPVKGYQPQTEGKVALVNSFKVDEELLLRKLDALRDGNLPFSTAPGSVNHAMADQRWLAIGRTALEQAFMAINRAVFKPSRVELPEDAPGIG